MHIGILFYSDTIALSGQNLSGILGRSVANHGFVKALITYKQSHKVTLFVTCEAEKEYADDYFKKTGMGETPNIVPYSQMAGFVSQNPLDVLHVLDPNLYHCAVIRDQVVKGPLVITGMTHTLGHDPFLTWMYLNHVAELGPFDTLVCTTPTAELAVQKMARVVSDRLYQTVPQKKINTRVIPLGVDTGFFENLPITDRHSLGIGPDHVVFLSLSRLSHRLKADLIPLLYVFKQVSLQTKQAARLIIAGATGQGNDVEILIEVAKELSLEGQVLFVDNPDEAQKRGLLGLADVFVAFSDNTQETFGLTIIEAMAAGLPVVAADWDGYRALVKHGQTGFLIPTLGLASCNFLEATAPIQLDSLNQMFFSQGVAIDVAVAAERLCELTINKEKRHAFAKEAKILSKAYDWQTVVKQYFDLWAELVRGKTHLNAGQSDGSSQDNSNRQSVSKADSFAMNYHEIFDHYPTRLLGQTDEVLITGFGKQALAGTCQVRRYAGMEEWLDLNLMALILKAVQKGVSVSHLINQFATRYQSDLVSYHVVWLCKYGLVAVTSA